MRKENPKSESEKRHEQKIVTQKSRQFLYREKDREGQKAHRMCVYG